MLMIMAMYSINAFIFLLFFFNASIAAWKVLNSLQQELVADRKL